MLEYRHATIGYRGGAVLRDVSAAFPTGTITAVVGPNGCGKSTLIQCLIGASSILGGDVLLDGKPLLSYPRRVRARSLAYLPQTRTSLPAIPVRLLVEHGRFPYMGLCRKKSAEDQRAIQAAMEATGVDAFAEQRVDTLSGGVRQRAFLAMLLAQDTPLLVLDEPTAYLDIRAQVEFLALVQSLRQKGKTVILVLHDLNQAAQTADRVLLMAARSILAAGRPCDCLTEGAIASAFGVRCIRRKQDGALYWHFAIPAAAESCTGNPQETEFRKNRESR